MHAQPMLQPTPRPCLRHIAQSWALHWQPGWPTELERALRHPIAGPLIRAGAWRLAKAEARAARPAACHPVQPSTGPAQGALAVHLTGVTE